MFSSKSFVQLTSQVYDLSFPGRKFFLKGIIQGSDLVCNMFLIDFALLINPNCILVSVDHQSQFVVLCTQLPILILLILHQSHDFSGTFDVSIQICRLSSDRGHLRAANFLQIILLLSDLSQIFLCIMVELRRNVSGGNVFRSVTCQKFEGTMG